MPVAPIANETKLNGVLAKPCHLAGIFSCAFLFFMVTMNRIPCIYDEGLILFGAVRILSGDVPYRDFYTNYGPAQFYALAALFKLFGQSVIVERMGDLFIRSSIILIIYLIIENAWSRRTALFTAFAAALLLTVFEFYGCPIFPCFFFSLLSLYCVLPVFRGRCEIKYLLASGACIGIVALFRYDVGVLAAAGGFFTLCLFHLTQNGNAQRKRKALVRSTVTYLCGVMLVTVPVILLLLSAVNLHDIWLNLVLPAVTYVRFRSLPFPSVAEILSDTIYYMSPSPLYYLMVYLPILGALVGGVAAFSSDIKRVHPDADSTCERGLISHRRWILVQLSALCAIFFLKGIVRVHPTHMALSIVPALMIVFVTIGQWRQLRYKVVVILLWLAFAGFIISSFAPVMNKGYQFASNVAWAMGIEDFAFWNGAKLGKSPLGSNSCHPPDGLERSRCFSLDQHRIAAIRYIQQRTKENEYIYVGLNRHDKIFINDILFYFESKRLSATKWHQFDPGIQTTKEIQSGIISDLSIRTPRYVVLSSAWNDVHEPNESALSSGVTLLDDFLRANYRLVASFGRLGVYILTPDVSP